MGEEKEKKDPKKAINIYLDESRIDNPDDDFMVIGGVFVDRAQVPRIKEDIEKIKDEHSFRGEIKWTSVDRKKEVFLKKLVTHVLELPSKHLSFHCIVVKRSDIDYERYHQQDKELAFFKFIYELLEHRLKNDTKYYVFLDFKPTKIKERVGNLEEILKKYTYFNNVNTEIKHCQAYPSVENVFIQIADLFSGAVGYQYNAYPENTAKDDLAKFIATKVGSERLNFASPPSEDKFNIFKIRLN